MCSFTTVFFFFFFKASSSTVLLEAVQEFDQRRLGVVANPQSVP